jgi:hypothetical protein
MKHFLLSLISINNKTISLGRLYLGITFCVAIIFLFQNKYIDSNLANILYSLLVYNLGKKFINMKKETKC